MHACMFVHALVTVATRQLCGRLGYACRPRLQENAQVTLHTYMHTAAGGVVRIDMLRPRPILPCESA